MSSLEVTALLALVGRELRQRRSHTPTGADAPTSEPAIPLTSLVATERDLLNSEEGSIVCLSDSTHARLRLIESAPGTTRICVDQIEHSVDDSIANVVLAERAERRVFARGDSHGFTLELSTDELTDQSRRFLIRVQKVACATESRRPHVIPLAVVRPADRLAARETSVSSDLLELHNEAAGIRVAVFPAARQGLSKLRFVGPEPVRPITLRVNGQPVELVEPFQDGLAFVRSDDVRALGSRDTRVEVEVTR